MKTALRILSVAGLALFGWVGAAQAVVIDLAGGGGNIGNSLVLNLGGGLSVTVTGHTHSGGGDGNAPFLTLDDADLHQDSDGLGVLHNQGDDDNDLDSSGLDDLIRFTFNQKVNLISVIFYDDGGVNDEFDMSVDEVDQDINALLGDDEIDDLPPLGGRLFLADFTGDGLMGTVIDFYTDDDRDDYRIRKLTVEAADAVPEPAALLLIGMGLAGLGIARRRRS